MIRFLQNADVPILVIMIFLGVGMWNLRGVRWQARVPVTLAFGLLLLSSNFLLPHLLMSRMEQEYPALLKPVVVDYVVVLGGHSRPYPHWPVSSQLGAAMLTRLAEGIRLKREIPGAKLIFSGEDDAEMMEKFVLSLGTAREDFILENKSKNTYEEMLYLRDTLKDKNFILVTSARHMPRAMAIFQGGGMAPIPAPTDYTMAPLDLLPVTRWIPSSGNVSVLSGVLYEYMGFAKLKLMEVVANAHHLFRP